MTWRLKNLSVGNRIAITVVVVLAVLFALALYGYLTGAWEEDQEHSGFNFMLASAQTKPELCMDEQTRDVIREIMLDALDDALKTHVVHTFEVWMKDETSQPARARNGVERGVRAYLGARKGALDWAPPPCPG